MSTTIEKVAIAIDLINIAIPGVTKIIITLKGGREIDLQDLVKATDDIVEQKLKEAREHLAKGGS